MGNLRQGFNSTRAPRHCQYSVSGVPACAMSSRRSRQTPGGCRVDAESCHGRENSDRPGCSRGADVHAKFLCIKTQRRRHACGIMLPRRPDWYLLVPRGFVRCRRLGPPCVGVIRLSPGDRGVGAASRHAAGQIAGPFPARLTILRVSFSHRDTSMDFTGCIQPVLEWHKCPGPTWLHVQRSISSREGGG